MYQNHGEHLGNSKAFKEATVASSESLLAIEKALLLEVKEHIDNSIENFGNESCGQVQLVLQQFIMKLGSIQAMRNQYQAMSQPNLMSHLGFPHQG